MNLDGHDTTSLDVVTEGRKSNAVVTFDSGGDKPPLHTGDVITISQSKEKKSSTLSILHRQLLPANKNPTHRGITDSYGTPEPCC